MIEGPCFRLKVLMFDFLKKHFLFTWLDVGHHQAGAGPSIDESHAYRFRSPDQLGLWICDMPFWAVKSRWFLAACGLSQECPEVPLSHLSCSCDHGWARVPAAERSLGHRLSASRQVSTIQQKAQPLCCDLVGGEEGRVSPVLSPSVRGWACPALAGAWGWWSRKVTLAGEPTWICTQRKFFHEPSFRDQNVWPAVRSLKT